jgi:uncharacterized protein YjbI with pentapeptide repeats
MSGPDSAQLGRLPALRRLAEDCTVLIRLQPDGAYLGSGFFVAPDLVMSCAHVVAGYEGVAAESVTVEWHGLSLAGQVRAVLPERSGAKLWPYPDLCVIQLDKATLEHPWVAFGDFDGIDDLDVYMAAYGTLYGEGVPRLEGKTGRLTGPVYMEGGRFWQLTGTELGPGNAGGPVVDLRSGYVCAVVKTSRSSGAMGGLVIPVSAIRETLPSTWRRNQDEENQRWRVVQAGLSGAAGHAGLAEAASAGSAQDAGQGEFNPPVREADIGKEPVLQPSPAGHAFISYVREDSGEVDALQRMLEAAGVRVWRDTSDLWPGEDWRAKIRDAITCNALVFIACISRRSVARETSYQNEELALAIDQLRRRRPDVPWLIPVRFDDCAIPDYDIGGGRTLASLQRADVFGGSRDESASRLVAAVLRILGPNQVESAPSGSSESGSSRTPDRVSAPSRAVTRGQARGMTGGHDPSGPATDHDGLYLRAVDRLGSDKAPVRLGALHALGRLGQGDPGLRQTVIKVICAYLRMPYSGPDDSSASDLEDQASRRRELQVRRAAQSIVAEHLRRDVTHSSDLRDGPAPETFWSEIDLVDLTGAYLVDLNLSGCRVRAIECNRAIFTGESLFRELRCDLAFFQGAVFKGHADFRGAVFTNDAWFSYSTFVSDVWFHGDEFLPAARFGRHAGFKNATFTHTGRFEQAVFEGSAEFKGITCEEGTRAVNLQGCKVQRPDAVNPDVSKAPSSWPPGWAIVPGHDGTGTITWCDLHPEYALRAP